MEDDAEYWRAVNEFDWIPSGHSIIKLPLNPAQIDQVESFVAQLEFDVVRRYSVAGHVAWFGWPVGASAAKINGLCSRLGRIGLALTGRWENPLIGSSGNSPFASRLANVFDSRIADAS